MNDKIKEYIAPTIEKITFEMSDSIAASQDLNGAAYTEWIFE